jgi:hypothetical protein
LYISVALAGTTPKLNTISPYWLDTACWYSMSLLYIDRAE